MGDSVVVASKAKEYIKNKDMSCGSDVFDKLDAECKALLEKAVQRAKENTRKTVQARDF